MLEDKKRATDWEATNEAIEEQVARESYLQWLRDQEKQARQVRGTSQVSHGLSLAWLYTPYFPCFAPKWTGEELSDSDTWEGGRLPAPTITSLGFSLALCHRMPITCAEQPLKECGRAAAVGANMEE